MPELGPGARTATQSRQAELGCIQSRAKPRRVFPEQILPVVSSDSVTKSSRHEAARRVVPEEMVPGHRISSNSKRLDPSACQVARQQPTQQAMPTLHSHLAAVGQLAEEEDGDCSTSESSSYDGSEEESAEASELDEGSDEGLEGGSEGGSEEEQPSKVIVEFGAAGDAWWHDFIAAKEEMLNDILQVQSSASLHSLFHLFQLDGFMQPHALCH